MLNKEVLKEFIMTRELFRKKILRIEDIDFEGGTVNGVYYKEWYCGRMIIRHNDLFQDFFGYRDVNGGETWTPFWHNTFFRHTFRRLGFSKKSGDVVHAKEGREILLKLFEENVKNAS